MSDMKKLIRFQFEGGTEMWVEEDAPDEEGYVDSSMLSSPMDKASQTFEQALDSLRPGIEKAWSTLKDLNNPQEIEIEFGIKLSGQVGAFLTSTSADANFNVKLKWTAHASGQ